jgi:hypothetical protein
MAGKKLKTSGGYEIGRLVDQSGGMVDEVVHPTLLQDSEAALLKNVSLDEKGTVKPCLGRIERFAEPFDPDNPCNGLYPFYPDTTTSRLIMGAGSKLFKDTPHLVTRWTDQAHFEETGSERYNCDTSTKPGEIRVKEPPKATFTRASRAYLPDGTSVDNDKPRFILDNLALGKPVATNGTVSKGSLSMVTDGCLLSLSETHVDITGDGEPKYVQVDLGAVKKIAEIRVWHYHADGRTYNDSKTEVSKDAVTWEVVFDSAADGTYKETAQGHRISFDAKEVRFIRDWVNGSDKNNGNHWVEIQALSPFKEGVLIEEGTSNLVRNSGFETWASGAPTGWATGFFSTGTIYPDNKNMRSGSYCIKLATTSADSSSRIQQAVTVSTYSTYTLSVEAKASTYSEVGIYAFNSSYAVLGSERVTLSPGKNYIKIQVSFKTGANSQVIVAIYPTMSGTPGNVWIDNVQLEKKSQSTTFMDGTRVNESLSIPSSVLSPQEGTVRAWVYVPEHWVGQTKPYQRLWSTKDSSSEPGCYCLFYNPMSDKITFRIVKDGGGYYVIAANKPTVGWHLFIAKWNASEIVMSIDGNRKGTRLNPVLPSSFSSDKISIGSGFEGGHANTIITDIDFSSISRTDEEDIAAYQSGKPLPVDEYTTAKMSFDGNINVTNGGFVWISDKKDMTNVQDTETGKVEVKVNTPGESFVVVQTRSGDDGVTWDNWQPVYADGTIQSVHKNYIQVKAIGHATETDKPSVQELILSYDGDPAAAELDTGLSPGGQWYFATLLSKCVMTNKLDPPKVWDGNKPIEILKGSPPHAQYITAHKNYLFMAGSSEGPSRLYFSEVLNIESWPVLNFIDVSPNDGDWITGLLPYDDYLIITKNRSVWLLVGSGPSDFEVRRIHDGIGCVAPRSLVRVVDSFAFASTEGIYLSDISTPTLISERLKETWKKMNRRRLHQIAGEFYDHKLRMDLPFGSSTVNNIRIIYDSIRKCLYLQEMSAHASCYAKYSEAGQEVLLFGHAGNGQVSHADTGTSDAGQPITMEWGTKHFNFGSSAIVKKARNLYFVTIPPSAPVEVQVYLIVDGEEMPTPLVFTVEPGKTVYKLKPRNIGVRNMRSLGYRIVVSETSGGVRFHELIQEYLMKKVKPS